MTFLMILFVILLFLLMILLSILSDTTLIFQDGQVVLHWIRALTLSLLQKLPSRKLEP